MNDKPSPQQEDVVPRKMSLLGHKTASERAVRTLRKNWTIPGVTPALPLKPSVEPQVVVAQPDTPPNTPEEPNGRAIEATDTSAAAEKKKNKDKKKKSKKKKNKDKKSKGKKAAK